MSYLTKIIYGKYKQGTVGITVPISFHKRGFFSENKSEILLTFYQLSYERTLGMSYLDWLDENNDPERNQTILQLLHDHSKINSILSKYKMRYFIFPEVKYFTYNIPEHGCYIINLRQVVSTNITSELKYLLKIKDNYTRFLNITKNSLTLKKEYQVSIPMLFTLRLAELINTYHDFYNELNDVFLLDK